MKIKISPEDRKALIEEHKQMRDKRICDRIKAVLMSDDGFDLVTIARVLLLHKETIRTHLEEYMKSQKLKPENGGSYTHLTKAQADALVSHLEQNTYHKVSDICSFVLNTYGVTYTISGMTFWLHREGFAYKFPKKIPAKADSLKQLEFIKVYEVLMNTTPEDEPIEFGDAVHPTIATKVTSGWIKKGINKPISTIASRSRINLFGSLNLETMSVTIGEYETIDSNATAMHFQKLRAKYPNAKTIHLILDNGGYNKSLETMLAAEKYNVKLHFLPPYSPNLNPIERLWKLMNEHARNNVVFKSLKEFKTAIMTFFDVTWPNIAMSMTGRINDNFEKLPAASSI